MEQQSVEFNGISIGKIHKIISPCIGLLFLTLLQKFLIPTPVFRFLIPAFIVFVAAVSLYNRWYLVQNQKYNFWMLLRQILLLTSALGMALVIPSAFLRGAFLVSVVFVIWAFESFLGNFAENLLISETVITTFAFFFTIMGMALYVPPFYGAFVNMLYILAIFGASCLTSRSFYEFTARSSSVKWLSSLVLGLFCTELFWAMNFLPFHFSVTAFLLLDFFYFCLVLNYYFLYNTLNFRKVHFHLIFIVITSAAVLLATPWRIVP